MNLVCRFGNSRKHFPAIPVWLHISSICYIHVQRYGHQLGRHTAGLYICSSRPCTYTLPVPGSTDQGEE